MSEENTNAVAEEKTERRERRRYHVTDAQFCETWTQSKSADEVATKLGMPKNIVLARSALYRKRGVELKKMERKNPRKLNVTELNNRIHQLTQE